MTDSRSHSLETIEGITYEDLALAKSGILWLIFTYRSGTDEFNTANQH